MREIKIRGYSTEKLCTDSQWVEGTGVHTTNFTVEFAQKIGKAGETFIFTESGWFEVYPESVGQYTGLKDKNGVEIFEGDILKCKCKKPGQPYFVEGDNFETVYKNSVVEWWQSHSNLGYRLRDGKGKTFMIKPSSLGTMDVEVIGNIYEHPHLLEVPQ